MKLRDVRVGQLVKYPCEQWVKGKGDPPWWFSDDTGIVLGFYDPEEMDSTEVECVVDVLWVSDGKSDIVDVAAISLLSDVV